MSRKYSSANEKSKHQDAVKLRKMTDDQLTEYVSKQYMNGFNEGIVYRTKEFEKVKDKISDIKGIGPKTQVKIYEAFEEIQ